MSEIRIAHMYPDLLNLYGDRGNLRCLQKRLAWRGHPSRVEPVYLNDQRSLSEFDLIFMGGGSDREQVIIYEDLLGKADDLWKAIEGGLPMLAICGGYQLLGRYYRSIQGDEMKGLGFFDFYTQGEEGRLIGNVVIEWAGERGPVEVVGFENHGGRTYLKDPALKPFGRVLHGFGNNGGDGGEGMFYKNLIGSYMHGPLLPKNPAVADFLLNAVLKRRGYESLGPLDDQLETFAHRQACERTLGSK